MHTKLILSGSKRWSSNEHHITYEAHIRERSLVARIQLVGSCPNTCKIMATLWSSWECSLQRPSHGGESNPRAPNQCLFGLLDLVHMIGGSHTTPWTPDMSLLATWRKTHRGGVHGSPNPLQRSAAGPVLGLGRGGGIGTLLLRLVAPYTSWPGWLNTSRMRLGWVRVHGRVGVG